MMIQSEYLTKFDRHKKNLKLKQLFIWHLEDSYIGESLWVSSH